MGMLRSWIRVSDDGREEVMALALCGKEPRYPQR